MLSVLLLALGAVAPTLGEFFGPPAVTHIDPHFPHYGRAHQHLYGPHNPVHGPRNPGHGPPIHQPMPCIPKTLYETIFKTDYEKVPVFSTVYKPKFIPTTYFDTIYKTKHETEVVPEYIPQYITETKFVNKYHTEVEYETIHKTHYDSRYVTETVYKPEFITKTDYVTQYETRYQPQYITETEIQPVHKTKVIYKTKVLYQTKYIEKPVVHKPIYEGYEKYGNYGGGSGLGSHGTGHDSKFESERDIPSKIKAGGGGAFQHGQGSLGLKSLDDGLKHDALSLADHLSPGGGLGSSLTHGGLGSGLNFGGGDVKHGALGFDESLKFTDEHRIHNNFNKQSTDAHLGGNLKFGGVGGAMDGKLGSNLALGLDHLGGLGLDTTKLGGALSFSNSKLGPGFDMTKTGSGLGFEGAFASGFGYSGLNLESLRLEHSLGGQGISNIDSKHAGNFALGETEVSSFGFRDVTSPLSGLKTNEKGPTIPGHVKSPFSETLEGVADLDSFSLSDRFNLFRGNKYGGSTGFRRRREEANEENTRKQD
ncbi:hypothetical protein FHG87_011788 [Trinorchestia longiramus]|nr:hypothetical protein FHG87_011788 [Trinorchestia longiramus]